MTIKRRIPAVKPAHRNPELKQGQTYRIIGARSGSYQDYIGRYFTAAYCTGRTYIVYMPDDVEGGGYDAEGVIQTYGIDFVQVDLQEA